MGFTHAITPFGIQPPARSSAVGTDRFGALGGERGTHIDLIALTLFLKLKVK